MRRPGVVYQVSFPDPFPTLIEFITSLYCCVHSSSSNYAGVMLSKVDPDANSVSLRASMLSASRNMKRIITPSQEEREQRI